MPDNDWNIDESTHDWDAYPVWTEAWDCIFAKRNKEPVQKPVHKRKKVSAAEVQKIRDEVQADLDGLRG